ncbi:immediate early response gene 2 protein [Myripristis murdjan]|uniref:Immediate early response gene 2 protein-like n=1 Tax=Myripristis murdjan TaxID=586833 RepID=A0A667YC83_9TELE|nr:immediate early response gene 2 protein-like [Myripristis murdjan]
MEVSAEAKRIMVVALGKLYSSRTQRGGLRLHRSLLLTLVMKSARDMYHAAQATVGCVAAEDVQQPPPTETSANAAGARLGEEEEVPSVSPLPVTRPPLRCDSYTLTGGENKENQGPSGPPRHARKRRGMVAAEPDFLPCKKAKLEQGACLKQVALNAVLVDYGNCGSELGAHPSPVPVPRAIAAF